MKHDNQRFDEPTPNEISDRKAIGGIVSIFVFLVTIILCACFCSCTKKVYIPLETINEKIVFKTDTLKQIQVRYDSIYVRDSIALIVRNDTVFFTKYKDQVKYLYRTDTVYKAKVDTVSSYIEKPVPYEVEKIVKVEKPLKWWQKTLMWMGVVLVVAIAFIIWWAIRRRK